MQKCYSSSSLHLCLVEIIFGSYLNRRHFTFLPGLLSLCSRCGSWKAYPVSLGPSEQCGVCCMRWQWDKWKSPERELCLCKVSFTWFLVIRSHTTAHVSRGDSCCRKGVCDFHIFHLPLQLPEPPSLLLQEVSYLCRTAFQEQLFREYRCCKWKVILIKFAFPTCHEVTVSSAEIRLCDAWIQHTLTEISKLFKNPI